MKIAGGLLVFALCHTIHATFHFYLEGTNKKCFYEDAIRDTLYVMEYKAEEFDLNGQKWIENHNVGIQGIVTFRGDPENGKESHGIINQRGGSAGKITWTASEPGDYDICIQSNTTGWFSNPRFRITVDMTTSMNADPVENKDHVVNDMFWKMNDLNTKMYEIKKEQEHQRDLEKTFRDQSEKVNAHAVWWTIVQVFVIGVTCVWQLNSLKGFFKAKKLI